MGLSDFSSKTTEDILVLFALKFSNDPTLKDKEKFLKMSVKIKLGELRNCRLYSIFYISFGGYLTFPQKLPNIFKICFD